MTITTAKLTGIAGLAAIAAGLIFILIQFIHPPENTATVTTVEWASGVAIARATGRCPWDYQAAGARFAINRYVRWDYFPLWAAVGLALEPVHDLLLRLTPAIAAALHTAGA